MSERVDGRTRDTRDRIRRTATELFYEQGFAATSIRQITMRCSITPAALYNHYSSKEELLADIFHVSRARNEALVGGVMSREASWGEQLALLAKATTWYHAAHRREAMVVHSQRSWLPEDVQDDFLEWQATARRRVEDLLAGGWSAGEFTLPDAEQRDEVVALTAKALLSGWVQVGQWFRDAGSSSPIGVAKLYARLALRTVGAKPAESVIEVVADYESTLD